MQKKTKNKKKMLPRKPRPMKIPLGPGNYRSFDPHFVDVDSLVNLKDWLSRYIDWLSAKQPINE